MRQLLNFNQYDTYIQENNLDRHTFVHQYFPIIVNKFIPGTNFTMIELDQIEWPEEAQFPDVSLVSQEVPKIISARIADFGIFERCYEDGVLIKIAYRLPSVITEGDTLIAQLPQFFNLSGAFSIGEGDANAVYDEQYISVYFRGKYQGTDSVSFAYKISKTTKSIIDVKLISLTIPTEYEYVLPLNKIKPLFGSFLNDHRFIEVGFSFETEQEYQTYLGTSYIAPQEYSTLGKGMIGLTIDTSTNSVVRTKRYFFGGE